MITILPYTLNSSLSNKIDGVCHKTCTKHSLNATSVKHYIEYLRMEEKV